MILRTGFMKIVTAASAASLLFAAACSNRDAGSDPKLDSFAASPTSVLFGGQASLTAVFSGGTGYIDKGIGNVSSGIAVSTGPLKLSTNYTMTVVGGGKTLTAQAKVTVSSVSVSAVSPAAPVMTVGKTKQFTATVGGALDPTVVWTASAGNIDGTGFFTAPSAAQQVTITATSKADGTKFSTTTATVVDMPAIASFAAAKPLITKGTATTVTAVFAGASGTVDNGVGAVVSGTAKATGNIVAPTTFNLVVANAAGDTVTAQTGVNVVEAPVASITAPAYLTAKKAGYTASVAAQAGATYLWTIAGGIFTSSKDKAQVIFTAGDGAKVKLGVTVTNLAGDAATGDKESTIVKPPWIDDFRSDLDKIHSGDKAKLRAVFGGGTGIVDHDVGTIVKCVEKETSPLTQSTIFTLTVTNLAGDTTTKQTAVSVAGVPKILTFTADNPVVTKGSNTTLRISYVGDSGEIDHGVGSVNPDDSKTTGAINEDTTFTLTATGTEGTDTKTVTVRAVDDPVATGITAVPTSLSSGGTTKVTPVFEKGTAVVQELPSGKMEAVTSGVEYTFGPLTETQAYVLRVSNEAGKQVSAFSLVTVDDKPQILLFNHPTQYVDVDAPIYIFKGEKIQLLAAFYGESGDIDGTPVTPPFAIYETPILTADTEYTLTVKKTGFADVVKKVAVIVLEKPVITSFTADKTLVVAGETVKLTGVFANGSGWIRNVGPVESGVAAETCPIYAKSIFTLGVYREKYDSWEVTQDLTVDVNE